MEDYPFRVEYAKSARASCKKCKLKIDKDELRIAVLVQSPKFDGKMPMWHHFDCFFRTKHAPSSVDSFEYFSSLRFEDQQRITAKIGNLPESTGKKSSSKRKASGTSTGPFSVEYAKSNRSACKVCLETIKKGDIRVSKMDYESETALRYGPHPAWHHLDCFVKVKDTLDYNMRVQELPGFKNLSEEDQSTLKSKLKVTGAKKNAAAAEKVEVPIKKIKVEPNEDEIAMKAQSDLLFGFRDQLQKELKRDELFQILEANDQYVPGKVVNNAFYDAIADILAFGSLKRCPECKGPVTLRDRVYKCKGNITEWTKCLYESSSPERRKPIIPESLTEKYEFLKNYKYVKRSRLFPAQSSGPTSKLLNNFKIAVVGFDKDKREELEDKIVSLGGTIAKTITKSTTCVIAGESDKEGCDKAMKKAQKSNVSVVSESFLEAAKSGKPTYLLREYSIKPWGVGIAETTKFINPGKSLKSGEKVKKVVVKGVAEADPESGLSDVAHVVVGPKGPYNAVLGLVNIVRKMNSYYRLQLLKNNNSNRYYVFRAWGRVGTTIGGTKVENFNVMDDALELFESLYLEKTGNDWNTKDKFVKVPDLFYPVEIDYGQDDMDKIKKLQPGNSKLPKSIQELITLIFDVNAMKNALAEFEIDLKKMPLGKLSKNQIMSAYNVLTELQNLLKSSTDGSSNFRVKILDASNRFYTLIPHDFGMNNPPLLDSESAIKSKTEMLDSLLEIEFAFKLLCSPENQEKDPIDHHYEQLKTDIEILSKDDEEFKRIKTYLKNTHAPTHTGYKLVLEEVFKIRRHGEVDKYKRKSDQIPNKKLLWHGSRITNFAGILTQGLRIAPPEAPVTGYMFGKGIYFADMVTKSANYCFTSRSAPTGLLLLCEVALGNMYEKTQAEFIEKLPQGKHSTKGIGRTIPDPQMTIEDDGVQIPCGKPVTCRQKNSSLLYNEYIVYDINQVNIKYLLKVRFDWM